MAVFDLTPGCWLSAMPKHHSQPKSLTAETLVLIKTVQTEVEAVLLEQLLWLLVNVFAMPLGRIPERFWVLKVTKGMIQFAEQYLEKKTMKSLNFCKYCTLHFCLLFSYSCFFFLSNIHWTPRLARGPKWSQVFLLCVADSLLTRGRPSDCKLMQRRSTFRTLSWWGTISAQCQSTCTHCASQSQRRLTGGLTVGWGTSAVGAVVCTAESTHGSDLFIFVLKFMFMFLILNRFAPVASYGFINKTSTFKICFSRFRCLEAP